MTVLRVSDLRIGLPDSQAPPLVRGIELAVGPGAAIGITGESGAGKTLTACAICGLLPDPVRVLGGRLEILGDAVDPSDPGAFRNRRGNEVFMVFQSPAGALDPCDTVGEQIAEALWAVKGWPRTDAHREAVRLMDDLGLDGALAQSYPHQLSGGQRQRVLLATAFALEPRVLVADEPTSGLDDAARDQVLELLCELRATKGTAVVMISHDLALLAGTVDELLVLHDGRQVESGPVADLLAEPQHPHTAELVRALRLLHGTPR